jgi:hypothetical protein
MSLFKSGKKEKPVLEETATAERAHKSSEIDKLWGAYRRVAERIETLQANVENRLRILEKSRQREQVAGSRAAQKQARLAESAPPKNGADDTEWERLERQLRG